MNQQRNGEPVTWWLCEPRRLARDRAEVDAQFPDLEWNPTGAGAWTGLLPRWPFTRTEPAGLVDLVGDCGLRVWVAYGHAYPMVPPDVYPVDPEPSMLARTDARWHVMGDGSLCLLRNHADWMPRDSVADLLLKSAAWRVEYALMDVGVIDTMTVCGIVDDDSYDELITLAAERRLANLGAIEVGDLDE